MFIHDVCAAFDKAGINYAIVGGYAVALHGALRGTVDVDMAIEWSLSNLQNVETVLKSIKLVSLLPINAEHLFRFKDEYVNNRNLIAWNFYDPSNPLNQIDILVNYDISNAPIDTIVTREGTLKVLNKQDLIEMKKASGRFQDLEDVKALEGL